MNWQIARDHYYAELFDIYGEEYIREAGYFDDDTQYDYNIEESLNIPCTPIDYIRDRLSLDCPNPAILLTTGSFNPIHDGHVEMMLKAKETIEKSGYTCVGGYFAPDHDHYMRIKLGDAAIPIHKRIKLIAEAIKDHEWLNVDSWAGIFHVTSINFTDIIYRLQQYIKKYLGVDIPIFFVCGSDNVRFYKTFTLKGHCVIIERPPYISKDLEILSTIPNYKNIFLTKNNNDNSSTQVRKTFNYPEDKTKLALRLTRSSNADGIMSVIVERFDHIKYLTIHDQAIEFKKYREGKTIISLDPFMHGDYNIGISRLYNSLGIRKLKYTIRPESSFDLASLNMIDRTKEVILFDDDVCSGQTMDYVESLLNILGINIKARMSFTIDKDREVLDLRDFIYKSEKGGLVIKDADDQIKRVPYIYPFVCPYIRGSIQDPMRFSFDMWEKNIEYYEKIGNFELVNECKVYYEMLKPFIYN
jgi:nicotinic acid mononucleotide adenylyltransferase